VGMGSQPRLGVLHNFGAATFDPPPALFRPGMLGKIVIEVESAIESGSKRLAVENDGTDEGRAVISPLGEEFRPGGMGCASGIPKSVTPCTPAAGR